jgi:hypothetical protein
MWPSYKEWRSSNFTSHRANDRRQHHLSHLIFILRDARELRRNFFSDRLGARRRVGGVAGRITSRLFAPDAQPLCSAFAPRHAGVSAHSPRHPTEYVPGDVCWCRLRESNSRPTVYKTAALPLS